MPRIAKQLSVLAVAAIKAPGLHPVGGAPGLHVQVSASGAKSWIARLTVGKRANAEGNAVPHRRDFGLGSLADVPLSEARNKARELRRLVASNIDPLAEKAAARAKASSERVAAITVTVAVTRFIEDMKGKWIKDPKNVSKRLALLATYITPIIGSLRVSDVESSHIVKVLRPVWDESPATAERLSSLLRNVFDWCKAHKYRLDNPAATEILSKLLPELGKGGKYPSLAFGLLPAFIADLRGRQGMSARALEATILSTLRTNEAVGGQWSEIDWDARVWTVPGSRMKIKGDDHRVPLSDALLALLVRLHKARAGPLMFPGSTGKKPLSDGAMLELLKEMKPLDEKGRRVVTHGFRSTFSTWASEATDHPAEVREMALAHKIKNLTEAAYRRGDLLEKRRALMADWAAYCIPLS